MCIRILHIFTLANLCPRSQAVKDARAHHSNIIDIFERMEFFFLRLVTYIGVQPTAEMRDIIIKIMIEVLTILAITTKEINQYRMSGFLLFYKLVIFSLIEPLYVQKNT